MSAARTRTILAAAALAALAATAHAQSQLVVASEDGEAVPLPLAHESYRVRIDRQHATTSLRHVYRNSTDRRLEGRFLLRAGDSAKVQGFSYWNGETRIVGEVFEKEVAAEVYAEVTGLDRDPGLLEQVGEGSFSFRVFPIEPAEIKKIEVEYGKWLRRKGHTVVYRAPIARASGSDIVVDITDGRAIETVTSPTHALKVTRVSKTHVKVAATAAAAGATELELAYELAAPAWSLQASVHRDAGHDGYLVVEMASPGSAPKTATTPKDVTIVLDRSGSMGGEPIEQARLAAADIVRRLGADDRLNVIIFDDGVDSLYARPKRADTAVRDEALMYIEQVRDEGGTNLALALERALAAQISDDRPDVILFLTDGQSDAQATLKVAGADAGDARVYTIGVGSGVEKPLLSRLAAIKRGRFVFIESADALTADMATLYSQIAEPMLVDVSIEVDGARLARTYPQTLPDLYVGDELRVASRIARKGVGTANVVVRGTLAGKAVSFQTEVAVPESVSRPWVGRVWAQARTDDLLEEMALEGETDEMRTEVINLAVAYNFATPYTSFLAIPQTELSGAAADRIADARERKAKILAAHKDAAALSRSAMPPGDPVLKVRAPRDAQQVTAYFPFGLVKDLEWDDNTEHWSVRFLVPKGVVDGEYDVRIVVLRADGTVQMATIPYVIDSSGPGFDVEVIETATGVRIVVSAAEESREVTVALASDPRVRIDLTDSGDHFTFAGELALPAGEHDLRVVVTDAARNEADSTVAVELYR